MTRLEWIRTAEDCRDFVRVQRGVVARRQLAWLAPYLALLGALVVASSWIHAPWSTLGLLVGAAAGTIQLWRHLWARLPLDPTRCTVDAEGILLELVDGGSASSRFAWAGVGRILDTSRGVLVDAAHGLWVLVPPRAGSRADLEAVRAGAVPVADPLAEVRAPAGYEAFDARYEVTSAPRPIAARAAPSAEAKRSPVLARLLGGLGFAGLLGLAWTSSSLLTGVLWLISGMATAVFSLLATLIAASRLQKPDPRELQLGPWRASFGERGVRFASPTSVSAVGWDRLVGAWRDGDRVVVQVRGGRHWTVPVEALGGRADALLAYVADRLPGASDPAGGAVARAVPRDDAGPFAAPEG